MSRFNVMPRAIKRDTWIPYTNAQRVNTPRWVNAIDHAIGKLMCTIGIHTDRECWDCWYCQKDHT